MKYAVEYVQEKGQTMTRFVDSKKEGIEVAKALKKEGARQIKVYEIITVWDVIWEYVGENKG